MERILLALAVVAVVLLLAVYLRHRSRRAPGRVVPAEVGLERPTAPAVGVVGFSSPYCVPCRAWEEALSKAGVAFAKVDVSERPDLARRYRVSATPLILAVTLPDGEVLESFDGEPAPDEVQRLAALAHPRRPGRA